LEPVANGGLYFLPINIPRRAAMLDPIKIWVEAASDWSLIEKPNDHSRYREADTQRPANHERNRQKQTYAGPQLMK
jgi:hypothetical protein